MYDVGALSDELKLDRVKISNSILGELASLRIRKPGQFALGIKFEALLAIV